MLQGSDFSENKNLQNLLILTAIKADPPRVMEYINRWVSGSKGAPPQLPFLTPTRPPPRPPPPTHPPTHPSLDNFDGEQIAQIAVSEQYELFEEGYTIYVKFAKVSTDEEAKLALNVNAIGVLVNNLHAMDRGKEFAERVNMPKVWSTLAAAQLVENMVSEAITSYIKAEDPSQYTEVISKSESEGDYGMLVPFLVMARKQIKEPALDTMLIYAYAKSDKLGDLEEFVSAPNVANIQQIGECQPKIKI